MSFRRGLQVVFIVLVIIMILIFLLFGRAPLMVIDAQSRSLSFLAVNNEEARIAFSTAAAVKTSLRATPDCLTGLFEPAAGSRVDYALHQDTLIIRVEAGRFLPSRDREAPIDLNETSSIAYGPQADCGGAAAPLMLPVWGPTHLGRTATAQTLATALADPFAGTLLSGEVTLFGRKIFGDGVYPAGSFSLPAGAQLSSESLNGGESAPWWGYALYMPEKAAGVDVLAVSATTTSKNLVLKRRARGPQTEKIEAGFLTRLTGDPLFALIGAILAGAFFLIEFLVALETLYGKKSD